MLACSGKSATAGYVAELRRSQFLCRSARKPAGSSTVALRTGPGDTLVWFKMRTLQHVPAGSHSCAQSFHGGVTLFRQKSSRSRVRKPAVIGELRLPLFKSERQPLGDALLLLYYYYCQYFMDSANRENFP